MNWNIFLLIPLALLGSSLTAREWTDTKGRTMQADLIGKTADTVTIRRAADGQVFTVPLMTFSASDRDYARNWTPPELPVPKITDAVYIITAGEDTGSGFIMQEMGQVYLYTNQHVIQGHKKSAIKAANGNGQALKLGSLQVIPNLDIARIHVESPGGLKFADNVDMDEPIRTFGNSDGVGVLTVNKGVVAGLSGDLVEVTAEIIPGNSGGPIVNKSDNVLGLATFISSKSKAESEDWKIKGTRYAGTRRFGLRIKPEMQWLSIPWKSYTKQGQAVSKLSDEVDTWFEMHRSILIDPSTYLDEDKYKSQFLREVAKEQNANARRFDAKIGNRVNPDELARMNRYENRKLGERMEENLEGLARHISHFRSANKDITIHFFTDQVKDADQWVKNLEEWVDTEMNSSRTFFSY